MTKDKRDTVDSARERLQQAKKDIDNRHDNSLLPEPKSIVSGEFDEVDLKKRQNKEDDSE